MPAITPGYQLGRYTIERSIGQGAFGEVFLGHHLGPGGFSRRVAIKVLLPEAVLANRGLEAFHREGRTAALLSHRNIIQVLDVGEDGEHHYLVMEHVDGIDLLKLGARVGRDLPAWVGVGIVLEVARGLAHAHALRLDGCPGGVVHRDVKPSNILLGAGGDVKLSDFGLAKRFQQQGDQLTVAGMVKGTPGFMSPEQMKGEESGAPSDVHALGAVLFWVLCGRMPRLRPDGSVLDGVPGGAIPPALEPVIEAAMSPVAERRPTAGALVQRLGGELSRLAPAGAVPNLAEEIGRWVKRARERRSRDEGVGPDPLPRTLTEEEDGEPFRPALNPRTRETSSEGPARRSQRRRINWRWGVVVAVVALLGVLTGLVASGDLMVGGCSGDGAGDVPLHAPPRVPDLPPRIPQDAARRTDRAPPAPDAAPDSRSTGRPERLPPREPPRSSPPPRPRGRGFLSVDSDPWSYVHLDGRRLGMTPLWRKPVPAGRHRLELRGRHRGHRRQIRIVPGRHNNLGRILLR